MLKTLLLGALLLAGCAPTRPDAPGPPHATPISLQRPPGDALPAVVYPLEDRPGLDRASSLSFFGKIWRGNRRTAKPDTQHVAATQSLKLPRKMKRGAQLTIIQGNGNTARQNNLGKSKGPTQQGTDSSTQIAATGHGDQTTATGKGTSATATHTVEEAPGALATAAGKLTGPVGWVLGVAAVGALGYGLYYVWYLIPRRKAPGRPAA